VSGGQFHDGDPVASEDVKFSFERAKGGLPHERVKEVVDPYRVRSVLDEPWRDLIGGCIAGSIAQSAQEGHSRRRRTALSLPQYLTHPAGVGEVAFEPGFSAGGIDEMCAMRDDSGDLLIVDFARHGHGLPTSNPA
jgi:ABC-type transport system substrate-binding protein